MPIQSLKDTSLGTKYGSEIGEEISNGLKGLAQLRLQQVQQRHGQQQFAKSLEGLNVNPERAQAVAGLDPKSREIALKSILQEPSNQAFAQSLDKLLGGNDTPVQTEPGMQAAQASPTIPGAQQAPVTGGINAKQALDLAKVGQKQQALNSKEKWEVRKARAPYVEKIQSRHEANDELRHSLDTMKKLNKIKSGPLKLNDPRWVGLAKKIGFEDFSFLFTPGSQAFNGAQVSFLNNLKTIFGSRPTNFDVGTYLRKLPGLMQSPSGRALLIDNWEKLLKAEDVTYNIQRDLLRKNPSGLPEELQLQAYDTAKPQIDQLYSDFEEQANNIINGQSSNFSTGQSVSKQELYNLPAGTKLEVDGKVMVWDGKKLKKA